LGRSKRTTQIQPAKGVMRYQVLFKEQAVRDVEVSFLYYEEQQPGLGVQFIEQMDNTMASVSENPVLWPVRYRQVREAMVRRFPFVILYEVEENHIIVYSVFHTSQHPGKKIKRAR